jgi:asparagine synthase (glutamine-hydrolysing)
VEEFTRLASESVEMRLMSEVPLGAFLSGGLDSSFIVALMTAANDSPVSSFTASLDGEWHDEAPFASLVAEHLGTEHHPLSVKADAAAVLQEVVWHLDEPLADLTIIPTYVLSRLTREFVTVALSGEGADELLGGYSKYSAFIHGSRLRNLIPGRLPSLASSVFHHPHISRALHFLSESDEVAAYRALTSVFTDKEKAALMGDRIRDLPFDAPRIQGSFLRHTDSLDKLMDLDIQTWLPNDILLKADRMSMAHSLEVRVPFLDHVLAEFLASVPSDLKLRGREDKHLLRKALQPLVPEQIHRRKKHGFPVPLERWMREGFAETVERALVPSRLNELGYWNEEFVGRLKRRNPANIFVRRQLLTLVMFDLWHRVFIEGEGGNPPGAV